MKEQTVENVQIERGKSYGRFSDHSRDVESIMNVLRNHYRAKNGDVLMPKGFETALFYMVSKLVRLSATPDHEDSALDLSSYSDLWLKIIQGDEYED